jgi:hypothetical protein
MGAKYRRNLEFANTDKFVPYMIKNIPPRCEFRIHVSGDFKDVTYVRQWYQIAKARPGVTFYTYTRSWRTDMWPAIVQLHNLLSNVNVNLSVDSETGTPWWPSMQELRWCYLTGDDTAPDWLRKGDIIFRSNHNARQGNHKWHRKKAIKNGLDPDTVAPLIHKIGKAAVCPLERGRDMPKYFSCARCHLCVDKPQVPNYV